MGKYLICFIGVLLILTSCSTAEWISGSWEGTGVQTDGKSWDMTLEVSVDSIVKVEYPNLTCGGIWNFNKSKNGKLVFVEQIEYGVGNCDQGVEIIVTRVNADELKVIFYFRSYDPKNPIASAILKRKS